MSFVLAAFASCLTGFWLWAFRNSQRGDHPLPRLPDVREPQRPRVSIVVAMRNEAGRLLRESVPSILQQLGGGDEAIFVDDHSTDETHVVVSALLAHEPRARIIRALEGRAGKRQALAQGAATSQHPFILFVDADVVLAPEAARRAVETAAREAIDCLSIFPTTNAITFWERVALVATSWVMFAGDWFRQTNDDARPVGLGVAGVFILVRRTAYVAIGGFEAISTNVLEDVAFAHRVRAMGCRYRYFHAGGLVRHRMYRSIGEIVDGMSKNTFPALGENILLALGAALAFTLALLGPWLLFAASLAMLSRHRGLVWLATPLVSGFALPWMWLAQERACRLMGTAPGSVATLAAPLGVPLWLFILGRSIYMNRIRASVLWRGRWIAPQSRLRR